ncbi:MAG: ABC-2 family transporter protein [Methyloligellaceae bacterium]
MWQELGKNISYIAILIPISLREVMLNRSAFWAMNIFMFIQNIILFLVWVIYFSNFSSLKGWQLGDVATLNGIAAFAYGLAFLFCGGALEVGRTIAGGELDIYLGRPRSPVIGLLFREPRVSGFGDILTGPALWFWFGNYTFIEFCALFLMGLCAAVILLATALIINCLVFFAPQGKSATDQLLESFIMIAIYPQNGFSIGVKVLLLTLIPAGFIAYFPINAVRSFDILQMMMMGGAAIFYMGLALVIFNLGLRRYTSGNKMLNVK